MLDSLLNEMLIVVGVWIVYWWCEGNMFVNYWHDVCQVQKKKITIVLGLKSRVVTVYVPNGHVNVVFSWSLGLIIIRLYPSRNQ